MMVICRCSSTIIVVKIWKITVGVLQAHIALFLNIRANFPDRFRIWLNWGSRFFSLKWLHDVWFCSFDILGKTACMFGVDLKSDRILTYAFHWPWGDLQAIKARFQFQIQKEESCVLGSRFFQSSIFTFGCRTSVRGNISYMSIPPSNWGTLSRNLRGWWLFLLFTGSLIVDLSWNTEWDGKLLLILL